MDKFARKMKYLDWYLEETYNDSCKPDIINETPATFPDPDMPTVIPDTGVVSPKIYMEMIYL